MDLGRLGLQGIRHIVRLSDHYRGLHEYLAQVLEGERSLTAPLPQEERQAVAPAPVQSIPFTVRDDIETFREQFSTQAPGAKAGKRDAEVFEALAPYFEAGFRLSRGMQGEVRLHSMFIFGRVFQTQDPGGMVLPFVLPVLGRDRVASTRARPVLRRMQLEAVDKLHDASAFLFEPRLGVMMLLICDRPHPWQVGHVERTHEALKAIYAPASKPQAKTSKKGLFR
jgi:hypothetical protein